MNDKETTLKNAPQPAWLIPAAKDAIGNPIRTPTLHIFHGTEEVPTVGPDGLPSGAGLALVFKCSEYGTLRRYGVESAGDGSDEPDIDENANTDEEI